MKTYRFNALMAGLLYFLGTVFGITSAVVGGDIFSSIVSGQPLEGVDMLSVVNTNATLVTAGAFFTLLMGISLAAMPIFLYPLFKQDSQELAMGMVIFRGALEGAWYFVTTLGFIVLILLSNEYHALGANSASIQALGNVAYKFQDNLGPVGSILFIIGASCLYISFYRTKLIPRWLTVWGMIGVVPYLAYAILHFFHLDNGVGFYLQMVLAPQEIIMGLYLIFKGFNQEAVKRLMYH